MISQYSNTIRWKLVAGVAPLLLLMGASLVVGFPSESLANQFATGYRAEATLPAGMMVSVVDEDERLVEPANQGNIDDLLGVVISGEDAVFRVTSGDDDVQVVTSGLTEVLVTDTNGEISEGDYVTASSINGIGMRSDQDHARVLGRAQSDFHDPATRRVETEDGEAREVNVARIPIVIHVGGNPEVIQEDTPLPGFVQGLANELAGEPVAPARIMIALIVITGGIIGATMLLYGAVSSTIIAIGRNPLSDTSIYAGLLRMVLIALAIISFSVALGYVVVVMG